MATDARLAKQELMQTVRQYSGLDQDRQYLGMSQIALCPRLQLNWLMNGKGEKSDQAHMRCLSGYMIEHEVLRLLALASKIDWMWSELPRLAREREIVSKFDPLFKGHIDAKYKVGRTLVEVKSFDRDDFNSIIRTDAVRNYPRKYVGQIQSMMRHSDFDEAMVYMVCRDPFQFWTVRIPRDDTLGAYYDERAKQILRAYRAGDPSMVNCECHRCPTPMKAALPGTMRQSMQLES